MKFHTTRTAMAIYHGGSCCVIFMLVNGIPQGIGLLKPRFFSVERNAEIVIDIQSRCGELREFFKY